MLEYILLEIMSFKFIKKFLFASSTIHSYIHYCSDPLVLGNVHIHLIHTNIFHKNKKKK
jgi:hypothetical protein